MFTKTICKFEDKKICNFEDCELLAETLDEKYCKNHDFCREEGCQMLRELYGLGKEHMNNLE